MTMIYDLTHITPEQTLSDLTDIVAEFGPDHSSSKCAYEIDGAPGCIVGQFLFRHGLDVQDLANLDDAEVNGHATDADVASLVNAEILIFDDTVAEILTTAQIVQDQTVSMYPSKYNTWGAALEAAKAVEI